MNKTDTADNLHQALVICLKKLGIVEMLITDHDIAEIMQIEEDKRPNIVLVPQDDGLHVVVSTAEEVREFAERMKGEQPSIIMPDSEIIITH